ncbi:AarF/ABC1/UbiB kinase family protein [Litoribacter ruber]|uniref:AarF/ABC1/UbiB kinase family protein n=1 Tax=Litoribacter ruber TaxID=702568 RepID=A0AAP2G1A7_9BACT|nr:MULTISPECIES: AarF/UbiB family protein [Litoribacter]MBS9524284.1 AarF/ABC1/UbiB kinase family protein [Litoribacter alkaliphilus]MBT0809918.1 AarF/ABC1/UbiB kinase family protein [Litoribacter ruber]
MGLLPDNYEKYVRFFGFIYKYWNSDVFAQSSSAVVDSEVEEEHKEHEASEPKEFAEDLKKMGPTYVKLGQLLSTRPDLLPDEYLEELAHLQDDVEEISYQEVEGIFHEELGVSISKAFKDFTKEPMASASIGQVHLAVLHSGQSVAVKIQRPGIRKRFVEDLDALFEMSKLAVKYTDSAKKYAVDEVIEELRYILLKELDYTTEAQNLETLKKNLEEFEYLFVPAPIKSFCSSKVLTMELVEGKKVTKVSGYSRTETDYKPMVDDLVQAYLKQCIVDGFVHADPHPGNIHITKDKHLALMDLGMVAHFSHKLKEKIMRLMIALSDYEGDKVADLLVEMSEFDEHEADIHTFRKNILRLVQEGEHAKATEMQTGRLLIHINRVAAQAGIHIPVELNILGKILLNMDQIVAVLTPDYDLQKTVRDYVESLMQKMMWKELRPGNFFQMLLDAKGLMENIPQRLDKITQKLADNELKLKIDAIDERRFTDAFEKVANRITLGLIVASMIIGAAMLIQIPTDWTILGYPGLAIILFLTAACIGFYLIYQILIHHDHFDK